MSIRMRFPLFTFYTVHPRSFHAHATVKEQTYRDNHDVGGNKNFKKKTPKKVPRQGLIQFTIQVKKSEKEHKLFSVYQADSSEDSARKLVQNLWLDEDLVPYFAAYIEERRRDPEISGHHFNTHHTPPSNYTNGKSHINF